MNFSLRTLLLIMAALSVLFASFVYVGPFVGDLFYTLGLFLVCFALIFAIYRQRESRAYWIGFFILFTAYFCHTVWPAEIRTTWIAFSNDFGLRTPGIISSRFLALCFQGIHGDIPSMRALTPGRGPNAIAENYIAFMTVGHTAIAILLGICGGEISKRLAIAQNAATAHELTSKDLKS